MEEAGTATTSTTHTSSKKARLPGGFGGGSRGDGAVCECVCEVCDQKNTKFFCASCLKYRIEQQRSKINAILERKQKLAVHVVQLTRVKNEQLHEERKRRMYENRIHSLRQRIQQMKEECVQEQVRVAVISSNNLEREKRLKEERKILEMRRSKYDVLRKTDLPRLRKQVEEMEEKLCVTRKKHCNTLVQLLPVYYPYNLSGTTAASSTSTAAAAAASSNKSSVLDSNSSMLSRRSADNHSNHLPPHPHHHVRSNNTLAITTTTTTTSSSHNNNNNNHSIPQPDTVCIISKDLQLPIRSRTFDGVDEDVVAGGLGYIVVVVQLLSWYLRVPLRYPMKYGGSKSTIHEIVIKPKHNNNNNNNSGTGINNNSNSSSSNGSSKSSTDTSAGPGVNGAGGVATTVSGITDDIVATALGSTVDPRLVTTGSMAEESYVIHQHRYPLFSKGVNHAMYEHGLALLNQNIVQLCLAQGVPILASSCASPVVASCSGPHQPLAAATAIVHATTATNNATTTNATPPQTLRTRSQSFTGSSPSSSAPADGGGGGPLSSGSSNVEILYGSLVGNLASLCSSKTLGSDGPWFQVLRPSPMLSLNYYHNLASSIHNDRHHRTAEAANHSKKQQGSNNNNNNSSSSSSEYNSGGSSDASSHYDTESMMAMINGSRHQHEQEEDDFVIVDAGISSTEVHVHYF